MNLIRRYIGHVAFGLAVGCASFEVWDYLLRGAVAMWLLCSIAVGFVLAVEFAVSAARSRRARRALPSSPRRRAHARPASLRQGRVHDLQTPTSTQP